jgi:hypothetical protein
LGFYWLGRWSPAFIFSTLLKARRLFHLIVLIDWRASSGSTRHSRHRHGGASADVLGLELEQFFENCGIDSSNRNLSWAKR